jgi:hypothetical protein
VHCGGANPRFNSLTVDGVRMNDQFGLNSNGYPTERQPFAYDSIEQVAVELAPFDVFYGQFTACNINAVTKSGSNEWHGSVFYDYTSDSLKGDKLEDEDIDTGDFDEKRYGATLGGPIIQDKLFFFLAYEKLEGANQFDRVAAGGATSGRVVRGASQDQIDEIFAIARDIYGYTPGDAVKSLPNEDEKYTIKLDWDINESHRANYSYNYNDGFNWSESDSDDDEYEFSDHYYERGAELKSHTGALFSNWTDRFSTELRVSSLDLNNRQISRSGGEFGEVQVQTWNDDDGDGQFSRATVYLGTDDSRHTNFLNYEALSFKLAGNYTMGDHLLTAGYEQDDLDVYNLFIQETRTENRFDEECGPTQSEWLHRGLPRGPAGRHLLPELDLRKSPRRGRRVELQDPHRLPAGRMGHARRRPDPGGRPALRMVQQQRPPDLQRVFRGAQRFRQHRDAGRRRPAAAALRLQLDPDARGQRARRRRPVFRRQPERVAVEQLQQRRHPHRPVARDHHRAQPAAAGELRPGRGLLAVRHPDFG